MKFVINTAPKLTLSQKLRDLDPLFRIFILICASVRDIVMILFHCKACGYNKKN